MLGLNKVTDGLAKSDLTPAPGVIEPRAVLGFVGVGALLREVLTLNKLIEIILILFGEADEAVLKNVMSGSGGETLR